MDTPPSSTRFSPILLGSVVIVLVAAIGVAWAVHRHNTTSTTAPTGVIAGTPAPTKLTSKVLNLSVVVPSDWSSTDSTTAYSTLAEAVTAKENVATISAKPAVAGDTTQVLVSAKLYSYPASQCATAVTPTDWLNCDVTSADTTLITPYSIGDWAGIEYQTGTDEAGLWHYYFISTDKTTLYRFDVSPGNHESNGRLDALLQSISSL